MEKPTRKQWDKATPRQQGFWSYMFSHWPGSDIPSEKNNPYPVGTQSHRQFQQGIHAGVILAQDSEE